MTPLQTTSGFTVVLAVVGVALLAYVVYRGLVQGKQLYGVERKREDAWDASHDDVVALAAARGWQVDERPDRDWPDALSSPRAGSPTCLLAVAGPDFEATSWATRERLPGAMSGVQSRIWLLRLQAPGVQHELFLRRAAGAEEALLLPDRFADRVAVEEPVGGLFAGGDYPDVEHALAPLTDRVVASGSWVLTAPGEVAVMATLEPDASGFEWRLDLARRVAEALSS